SFSAVCTTKVTTKSPHSLASQWSAREAKCPEPSGGSPKSFWTGAKTNPIKICNVLLRRCSNRHGRPKRCHLEPASRVPGRGDFTRGPRVGGAVDRSVP